MDHTCPKCNSLLQIGETQMEFENDTTPDLPTIAYTVQPMYCMNKNCDYYAGENLKEPKFLVDLFRNRVN
jgi:hypothetical protein